MFYDVLCPCAPAEQFIESETLNVRGTPDAADYWLHHAIVHLWLQGLNVRNVLRGRSIHARLCGHGGPASLGHCCSSGTFLKMWQHVPGYDMSGLMCHV